MWREILNETMVQAYRATFSTPSGQTVLLDLVNRLGVFSHNDGSQGSVELHNFGLWLLATIGGGGISDLNTTNFLNLLTKQPILRKDVTNE